MAMPSALEISRPAAMKPIAEIPDKVGILPWLLRPFSEYVAKKRARNDVPALSPGHNARNLAPGPAYIPGNHPVPGA
jgi:hypothetical protein